MHDLIEYLQKFFDEKTEKQDEIISKLVNEIKKYIVDNEEPLINYLIENFFDENSDNFKTFYEKIGRLTIFTHQEKTLLPFWSNLWAIKYSKVEDKNLFLEKHIESKNFWNFSQLFETFLPQININSNDLYQYLVNISQKIEKDLAQSPFINGIEERFLKSKTQTIEIIEICLNDTENKYSKFLLSNALGILRVIDTAITKKFEEKILSSEDYDIRKCLYFSFETTNFRNPINTAQGMDIIKLIQKKETNIECAFYLIAKIFLGRSISEENINEFLPWIELNIKEALSAQSKYSIAEICNNLIEHSKEMLDLCNKMLLDISPIEPKYTGILEKIEYYLLKVLNIDINNFYEIFEKFVELNYEVFLVDINSNEFPFQSLIREINKGDNLDFVSMLCFSKNSHLRSFGRDLFEEYDFNTFSVDKVLENIDVKILEIILMELQVSHILGKGLGKFYYAISFILDKLEDMNIKEQYKKEMIFQTVNFPGVCLDFWEKAETKNNYLNEVISIAQKHLEKYKDINTSPINSFIFPGIKDAAEKGQRDFQNMIRKNTFKNSVFLSILPPPVVILYGNKMADYNTQNGITGGSELSRIEHSIEIPLMEYLDPEGMALKRLHFNQKLRNEE